MEKKYSKDATYKFWGQNIKEKKEDPTKSYDNNPYT